MKVYVVTGDEYQGAYGAEIYIYAVCKTMKKATDLAISLSYDGTSIKVTEMELDVLTEVYLGGYVE